MNHPLSAHPPPVPEPEIRAERLAVNPIVDFNSHPSLGNNINGPSLIRVPDWIKQPLGRYYLYFGHHGGRYIRLAFAEHPEGPWTIHPPGVLPLASAPLLRIHLASPDVHIDHESRQLLMFFHGPVVKGPDSQMTQLARSEDGLHWEVGSELLGKSYFRVFQHRDWWYAIANGGCFYRTRNIDLPWEEKADLLIPPATLTDAFGTRENQAIRHSAFLLDGSQLLLFYTRKGDAPERVFCVRIELTADWNDWRLSKEVEVLRPEMDYEGIRYENLPSKPANGIEVRQLRDPAIYREGNRILLIYSVAGEMGLAMADLKIKGIND